MATITNSLCANTTTSELQTTAGIINIGTTDLAFATTINIGSTNLLAIGDYTTTIQIGGGAGGVNISSIAGSISSFGVANTFVTIDEDSFAYKRIVLSNAGGQQLQVAIGNTQTGSNIILVSDPLVPVSINSAIATAPVDSSVATAAFTTSLTSGTEVQNTTGYNLLANICVNVTSATGATITLGVGAATGPTANTIVSTFTVATSTIFNFSALVPNNYYLVVDHTGTITVGSINVQSCPM